MYRMKKLKNALFPAVGGCIFLGFYLLFFYKTTVNEVFAPNTTWNDDVLYYKQLSAVITHGYPRGFFGYNESQAYIGSFGTWGPVLFYIYALPAYIIGVKPNTMLFCNVFFVLAGWSVFVNSTKISWKQQILIALMISFMQLPVRYILSGMSEALGYSVIIMIVGISYAELQTHCLYRQISLILLTIIYTLIRPYGIVFGIFPVIFLVVKKKYKAYAASCLAGGCLLALSVFLMKKFAAPYYYSSISNEGLQLIFSGEAVNGFIVYFRLLIQAIKDAASFVMNDWNQGQGLAGIVYGNAFFLVIVLIVYLVRSYRKKQSICLEMGILLATLLIFLIISSFYAVYQGARHMLILCVGIIMVLVLENWKASIFAAIGIFVIFMGIKWNEPEYPLRYEETIAHALEQYADVFAEKLSVDENAGISWDNTVSFDTSVDFRWIYCITDGMGIQFDKADYLENPDNEVKSRYVVTQSQGSVHDRFIADNYRKIIETEHFVVLERFS